MYLLNPFRVISLFCLILLLTACGSKSDKYKEANKDVCQNSKIENQFIAHWTDAEPSLIVTPDVFDFINRNQHRIKFIEPNYALQLQRSINYVRFSRTLSAYKILHEIGALRAWRRGFQGQNVLIAVIDSGIDIQNPKLSPNIYTNPVDSTVNGIDEDNNGFIDDVNGWNFTNNNNQIIDEIGHGTSIAGIITGQSLEGESLGIAPGSKILPVDIMSGSLGNEFDAKKAVEYAVQMNANIINNSWTITCSYYLSSAFEEYQNKNILFVNSAGNAPIDVLEHQVMPASLSFGNFLNVGSTNLYGDLSRFSGFGRTINIWAPGEQVPVLSPNGNAESTSKASGTSISAAVISGAAALVWSAHPGESAQQIADRIKRGAERIKGRSFIAIDRAAY